ncbi:MAG: restriction endonuclease subunit S [Chloroflexota bacterium]|nr:restriction endonuclease subunit S [Chloroflexota bacterium]
MTSPVDIRPDHLGIVQDILIKNLPAGVKVWVFGSRANWTTKDSSDLDLALEGEGKLSHKVLGALKDAFENSSLPYTVDVVDFNRIGDAFKQIVELQRTPLPLDRVVTYGADLTGTSGEWDKTRLGDVCTKIGSGATPRGGRDVYLESGPYSLIRSQNVYNDGFRRDGLAFIGEHHADALENVEVFEGDVLLNITGDSVARVCQVPMDALPARVNQHVAIVRPGSAVLDPEYLRYYLVSADMQTLLLSWAGSGSTRNALTKGMIESLEIPLPPLPEQRAIAHILGTLDDKIELNRRMNETLEAMARALFKSWFVDFDPVRAKMEGRDTGLPPHIAALFPDRLVTSELGEIPEGWEVKELGEVARQCRSVVKPEEIDAESPYIALEHMPKRCIALTQWSNADGLASNKFKFEQGDILFGKLRPYFHKVGVAPLSGVCSTDIVVMRPNSNLWFGFVLGHTSSPEFVDYTDATSTGTRMPRTNWSDMSRYTIALPSMEVSKAFTELVEPCVNRIVSATHESHSLAAQRDALLPGLVSGAVKV